MGDRGKFDPLQERLGRVRRLAEDAPVERQPRQLPVQIQRRVTQGGREHQRRDRRADGGFFGRGGEQRKRRGIRHGQRSSVMTSLATWAVELKSKFGAGPVFSCASFKNHVLQEPCVRGAMS